jgi:hypothetical protein
VRELLVFATEHRGYTFEQALDIFLAALAERTGVKPWRIRRAQRSRFLSIGINIERIRVNPGRYHRP